MVDIQNKDHLYTLKDEINMTRQKLNDLVTQNSIKNMSSEILKLSEKLDKLLILYIRKHTDVEWQG